MDPATGDLGRHAPYLHHLPTGQPLAMPPRDSIVVGEIFPFTYQVAANLAIVAGALAAPGGTSLLA